MQISLRSVVLGNYRSISDFARAISWDRKKASAIINGTRRPTAEEMEQIAAANNITSYSDFMSLFFPSMSTK